MRPEPQLAALAPAHAGSSPTARALGAVCLTAAALALLGARRKPAGTAKGGTTSGPGHPGPVGAAGLGDEGHAATAQARSLHGAAALLALSVLLDSAIEHYRGQFENPGMFAPLVTSLATFVAAARAASKTGQARAGASVYATALGVGIAGAAFHVYNLARRPGGFCWQNLFYAAPLVAPAGLGLAGAYGLAARSVDAGSRPASLLGLPAGRALSGLTAFGIAGTVAEAGLLHFRGAFHRPAMWLPVTLPPLSAAFLLRAAAGARDRFARVCLGLTALLGVAGVGFHANGVARQMGGWRNWRQNLLSGPPLPAPPAFLALALAGRSALALND
jgi:hypothetical protein